MRPLVEIPPEFFAADEGVPDRVPLLDAWLARFGTTRPLHNFTALLIQHQLSNQAPMVRALVQLGLDPRRLHWLDIPYTAHQAIRSWARDVVGVPDENLSRCDYRVLDPYGSYQRRRATEVLLRLRQADSDALLVLDDGAYVIEALAGLAPARWPRGVTIVEQTTRGFLKLRHDASLEAVARQIPVVNVAESVPKKLLEPPFIAMAICAALQPHLRRHFGDRLGGRCLILGYGAIGEQVASWVRYHFALNRGDVHVHDPETERAEKAAQRGFKPWDRGDFNTRFRLVIGCSGQASFKVGDYVYLEDGALLVSASSGSVELSRQDFIELADTSDLDDIRIIRNNLDPDNIHADLDFELVDRRATFVNGGFPVNFDGRLTVVPLRYIQPTPTMMVAAAVQATSAGPGGRHDLDVAFCDWIDGAFRELLGDRVQWLIPPPDEAW